MKLAPLWGSVLLVVLGQLVGAGVAVGALLAATGGGWAARRTPLDRWVWWALAVASASLALVPLDGVRGHAPVVGALKVGDLAGFVFATAGAAAFLAWPEIRSSTLRVAGSLIEVAVVVLVLTLWGMVGFAPLSRLLPAEALAAIAHSGIWAVPAITAAVVTPQLSHGRPTSGFGLVVALLSLWAGALLGSRELQIVGFAQWPSVIAYLLGFAVLGASVWRSAQQEPLGHQIADNLVQPPFRFVGLIGIAGVGMALVALPPTAFVVVLLGVLAARELLHAMGRRRAHDQLESSLQLEGRLLRVQSQVRPGGDAADTLGESCGLALDVLRADSALAWIVDGEELSLAAVAPTKRDALLGRRLMLSDLDSVATRVFSTGSVEQCEVRTPGVRVNGFFTTLLDVGVVLGLPIRREGAPVGVLVLVRERGRESFSHFDLQRAKLIVAQTEGALRRLELYDELEQQLRETTLVHRFAVQAVTVRKPNDVGWYLLESIRSRVPFERAAVFLTDAGSRLSLTPIAHFHPPNTNRPQPDASMEHLRLPLQYGEELIGYADLYRAEHAPFSAGEAAIAERLAQQAAVAIQNVKLQEVSGKVTTYRELDRLKTELLNAVSHDLRGPLANIKGYASTLVESASDMSVEEQKEFLVVIEEEADRLRDLLDHLLDLSKIEAGVLQLDLRPVQLARVVSQTVAAIQSSRHTITMEVPEETFVMADGRRFRQVLHNLLENAVKYSPNGGDIFVRSDVVDGEIVISVKDAGVGIPRHQWDRVFRPYQRADTARSHGISGTGLGLAICKGIVEGHGGRIWLESETGVGTTFSFTMPRGFNVLDDPLAR